MVGVAVHIVGQAVVAYIYEDKKILSANSLLQHCFSLAAVKTGRAESEEVVFFRIALKGGIVDIYVVLFAAKVYKIVVDLVSKLRGAV